VGSKKRATPVPLLTGTARKNPFDEADPPFPPLRLPVDVHFRTQHENKLSSVAPLLYTSFQLSTTQCSHPRGNPPACASPDEGAAELYYLQVAQGGRILPLATGSGVEAADQVVNAAV
jgi:hypothetical protein